jgi:hypothetical protein
MVAVRERSNVQPAVYIKRDKMTQEAKGAIATRTHRICSTFRLNTMKEVHILAEKAQPHSRVRNMIVVAQPITEVDSIGNRIPSHISRFRTPA